MSWCTYCCAINVATLPTFTSFSRTFSIDDLHKLPFQPHHSSLRSLRISAQTCQGCALFLGGLTKREKLAQIPGLLFKHVGAEGFGRELWNPYFEEKPIMLRGLGREGFTDERKQLFGILAQCDAALTEFDLFADEDSLAALQGVVVGRIPAAVSHPDRISGWLRLCNENHPKCASYQKILTNAPSLPTRVFDLGMRNPSQARLVPGTGLEGKYVTLSHCWGSAPLIKTTKETFPEFMKAIDVASLNKTFRDAIVITQRLGLRYLWIDSLYIIQDDAADWEREAAWLAYVYDTDLAKITLV